MSRVSREGDLAPGRASRAKIKNYRRVNLETSVIQTEPIALLAHCSRRRGRSRDGLSELLHFDQQVHLISRKRKGCGDLLGRLAPADHLDGLASLGQIQPRT